MSNKPKNFALSENGQVTDITVEVSGSKTSRQRSIKNIGFMKVSNSIKIEVPRSILFKELITDGNWFDRVSLSGDRRLIMSGRVLI